MPIKGPTGGITLGASTASFDLAWPAGAAIADLNDPFGGGSGYAAVGTVPAALALSGNRIMRGLAAATAGQAYAVKVRATSADGAREVAETLSFTATGVVAAITYLPALSRAPAAVYSLYRLVAGYAGPVARLYRASDGAMLDIATGSDGQSPDLAAVAGWIGSSSAGVLRYDQSGLGNHETQAVADNRPQLVLANAAWGKQGASILTASQYAAIPATVTADRANATIAMVGGLVGDIGAVALGSDGSVLNDLTLLTNGSAMSGLGNSFARSAFFQPVDLELAILTSGAAAALRVGTRRQAVSAQSSIALAGGRVGMTGAGWTNGAFGEHHATVIYPAALADADEAALATALRTVFAIPTVTDQLVFLGDSIQAGQGASGLRSVARRIAPNLSRRCRVANLGVPGRTQAQIAAAADSVLAGYDPALGRNIAVNNAGTNDIAAGTTGTALWSSMQTWITAARNTGYLVAVSTLIPRQGLTTAQDTERQAYNTLLADNAAGAGIALIDYASIAQLADPTNRTYYADGTHPTDAGYALEEQVARTTLNAMLG